MPYGAGELTVVTLIFRRGRRKVDSWGAGGCGIYSFGIFPLAEAEAMIAPECMCPIVVVPVFLNLRWPP